MSEDLIKRSDVISALYKNTPFSADGIALLDRCETEIRNIPSIDIEPKRGEWKRRIVDSGFNADWVCSECGYRVKTDFVDYNFCPNCGARMKGADDE